MPAPAIAPDEWNGPRRFDDFEVIRPLGHGGMGQVFLGRDLNLDRPVALKFTTAADPSPGVRARFLREARAIARLSHPNVVGIYRIGEVAGRPYLAYEFVEGDDLDRMRTPMPWPNVARIGLGLARGLAAAHKAGVLHRDIKPSNAMLTSQGEVKLLDFGLARFSDAPRAAPRDRDADVAIDTTGRTLPSDTSAHLTNAGALLGTPAYLPPEAWRRDEATERSDLYALGLVLYELLSGTLPHGNDRRTVLADAVLHLDAPSVRTRCHDALPSLAELIDQCLRRAPEERPESAESLARSLARICELFVPSHLASLPLRADRDAELVASSLRRALSHGDALTARVYERLFTARPDLRQHFPSQLDGQREKLLHALKLSFEGLHDHARLVPVLRDLGRRHAGLHLQSSDYDALGGAMLGALSDLDPALDDDTLNAWRRAYSFITTTMRSSDVGVASISTHAASSDDSAAPPSKQPEAPPRPRSQPSPSGSNPDRPPPTRYAFVDDQGVAFQTLGAGARDVILHLGRVSHLDYGWRHPSLASWLRNLASLARLVLFDKRGTGLSERAIAAAALQARLEDPYAVLDAAGVERPVFIGVGEGGAMGLIFAALFPERVRAVVCVNASARMLKAPGYPGGIDPNFLDGAIDRIRKHWGEALLVEAEAPSMSADAAFRAWFGEYLRSATSPGNAIAQLRLNATVDARWILPHVRVPVLVLHRRENRLVPASDGRYIADHVAGARFVELPGGDHLPFTGETGTLFAELRAFLSDPRLDAPPPAALAPVIALRAEAPDAPALSRAVAKLTEIGARRLDCEDPRAAAFTTPWFGRLAETAVQLVSDPSLRGSLGTLSLDAPDLGALVEALEAAKPGECVCSTPMKNLCEGMPLRFELLRGSAFGDGLWRATAPR